MIFIEILHLIMNIETFLKIFIRHNNTTRADDKKFSSIFYVKWGGGFIF